MSHRDGGLRAANPGWNRLSVASLGDAQGREELELFLLGEGDEFDFAEEMFVGFPLAEFFDEEVAEADAAVAAAASTPALTQNAPQCPAL